MYLSLRTAQKKREVKPMDKRISYKLVLDTETTPLDRDIKEVMPNNMFVYDIGWAIVDKRGKVYRTRSFIVADIFLDERNLMKSAYYANKIPQYWKDLKEGKRTLLTFYNIRKIFYEDIAEYSIKEVYGHNMLFDYGSLNNSQRWLTKSKFRYFFTKDLEICDTLKMARDILKEKPTYKRFCQENGYMTKNNQVRYTAEVIYRFITQDTDFIESHTGLEDVLIEKEILAYCFKQKKKMRRHLWNN